MVSTAALAELLRRYADEHSENAFAELVRRQIGFVYAAALRQVKRGDPPCSTEVARAATDGAQSRAADRNNHLTVLRVRVFPSAEPGRDAAWVLLPLPPIGLARDGASSHYFINVTS